MRKITVLGIELNDYSVRESMRRVAQYLNNGICNTVDFITHDALLLASADESIKSDLEGMDMVIFTSSDILEAANVHSRSRAREIESNLFLKALLRKLAKEKRSVFLISSNAVKLESLASSLRGFFGELNIVSSVAGDESVGGDDFIVNEVNMSMPDVVIMNPDGFEAENFIRENRMKINAQLIVILRDVSLRVTSDGNIRKGGIGDFLLRKIFRRAADNYEKENSSL